MSKNTQEETYEVKLKRAKDTCIAALKLPSDASSDNIVLEVLIRYEQEEDIEREIMNGQEETKPFHMTDGFPNPAAYVINLIKLGWFKIKNI